MLGVVGLNNLGDGAVFAAYKEGRPVAREMDGARAITARKLLGLGAEPRFPSVLLIRWHILPPRYLLPYEAEESPRAMHSRLYLVNQRRPALFSDERELYND